MMSRMDARIVSRRRALGVAGVSFAVVDMASARPGCGANRDRNASFDLTSRRTSDRFVPDPFCFIILFSSDMTASTVAMSVFETPDPFCSSSRADAS